MLRRIRFALLAAGLFAIGLSSAVGQDKNQNLLDKINQALPEKAQVQPKKSHKILIFSRTKGFRHGSIATGIKAITMLGDKTGAYTAHATEDESFFEPEKLKMFDAVFMLNTTGDCFKPNTGTKEEIAQREELYKKSLADFVASGKGLAGVHSATDTYHKWKEYNQMMGGTFAGHPWHTKVPVKNLEPNSPINAAFGGQDFEITDEIYQFRADTALPTDRKFLLSLDTKKMDVSKGNRKDGLYPVSWISTFGKGRTFYCSLGHRDEIYMNPAILRHYLAGIQYVLGDLDADARPTAK